MSCPPAPGRTVHRRDRRRTPLVLALLAAVAAGPAAARPIGAQPTVGAPALSLADVLAAVPASPLARGGAARAAALAADARQQAAFGNPTAEWRREGNPGVGVSRDEFVQAALPLDVTGRRLALRAAARDVGRAALADSTRARRDVEALAVRLWVRAALAAGLRNAAEAQRDAAARLAAFDAARLREGAVAENVALRTRVEADRQALAAAGARAEEARARGELARLLGRGDAALPPTAPLPDFTAGDAAGPAAAAPDTAVGAVASEPDLPAADSLAARAVARALAARPDLQALRATAAAARARQDAERRATVGDALLVAGTRSSTNAGAPTVSGAVLGVSLPLPLLNRNAAGRERAAAERRAAEADLADAEALARGEAEGAARALVRLAAVAPAGAALDRRADDVATIALAAYREGGASLLEVLEAQRARAEARAAALRWSADLLLARLDLLRATGAPLTAAALTTPAGVLSLP